MYKISYLENVIKKDIPALPLKVRSMVYRAIEERLTIDPLNIGKPLRSSLKWQYRLRVSSYRIIYRVDTTEHKVVVIAIKHRKEAYSSCR